MPNAPVPAAALGLPNANRRRLLLGAAASALLVQPAVAQELHPDAALLAFEPKLRGLKAEMAARLAEADRIEACFEAALPPRPRWGDPHYTAWVERWNAAKRESGYEAAYEAFGAAVDALNAARDEIAGIRARTLDGLCLKVRYGEGYDHVDDSIVDDLRVIDAGAQA